MTPKTTALFSARKRQAETALSEVLSSTFPADTVLSQYFRRKKGIGHADRAFIAKAVYAVLRYRRSLAATAGDESPQRLLDALFERQNSATDELAPDKSQPSPAKLPSAVRLDLPDWLYAAMLSQWGKEKTAKIADSLNTTAPLDLRVNSLKTTREAVLSRLLEEGIAAAPCPFSPFGLRLTGNPPLARHPLFLDGTLEVQDEGSQLIGLLTSPKAGEMVADFCAGAGGKTLLLGALMRGKGRLYAFDISGKRLAKFEPRLARSGLSNVYPIRITHINDTRLKRLSGKLDRVLVDAPCSGLGTLRRNPDLKWRHSPESVSRLAATQAEILGAAAKLVKPGGRLVYATCSVLAEENESVAHAFLGARPDFTLLNARDFLSRQYALALPGEQDDAFLRLSPLIQGTDGFFAAAMVRQDG